MIRTVIVDDEQHCTDRLNALVEERCANSVHVLQTFDNVNDALVGLKKLQPELLFLDVQIHDKTGFELLQSLGNVTFDVVFTTAYEKFAVQAIKFSALDYLLKPIDGDEFEAAVEKVKAKRANADSAKKIDTLFHNLNTIGGQTKRISVPTMTGFEFLQVGDIVRCESDVNYTTIFMKDKQKLMVAKTLKEFEELLTDFQFFRVHNSHLVNMTYVKSYLKGKGGCVVMSDNSEIQVSVRRKDDFLKALASL